MYLVERAAFLYMKCFLLTCIYRCEDILTSEFILFTTSVRSESFKPAIPPTMYLYMGSSNLQKNLSAKL